MISKYRRATIYNVDNRPCSCPSANLMARKLWAEFAITLHLKLQRRTVSIVIAWIGNERHGAGCETTAAAREFGY